MTRRLARDDQALAGDDHPAAVLAADRIDAADPGDGIAGINLVEAAPALDQRAAIGDVAEPPTVDCRQAPDLGLDLGLGAAGSGAGAAATVATWAGAIVPVVSFAGVAAAACAGAAAGVARSLSTVSDSLAILAIGSAWAFSSLSRRSLVRLNWLSPSSSYARRSP